MIELLVANESLNKIMNSNIEPK